jgi:hypothetical protein
MKIEINNRIYPGDIGDKSLKNTLLFVEQELRDSKEIITELSIDGQNIDLSAFPDGVNWEAFNKAHLVSIKSLKQSTAALIALKEGIDLLENLEEDFKDIAFNFSMRDDEGVYEHLATLLDRFIWLMNLIEGVAEPLYIDYRSIQIAGKGVDEFDETLTTLLKRMLSAQEEGEHEKIASIIEMELVPIIAEMNTLLPKLREQGLSNLKQIN